MLQPEYYTFLLAQIFGAFSFILAVVVMRRMPYFRKLVLQIQAEDPLISVFALMNLLIGVILVVTHNFWVFNHRFPITVICWLILLNALLWLLLPAKMLAILKKIVAGGGYYWLIVFLLVFGIVFLTRSMQLLIAFRAALGAPG
ncbi:MAG: hypothetical protein NXI01_00420 [Gammaproteobacteria bacterium]|nr:hypothetical protein [Gammaproteobacteria bacterium]